MQQWMVVSGAMQRDPLTLLLDQETQRLEWLLPVRHSRMAESPFAYFRGAAAVMAADLARHNHSGLLVQLCGDAHLLNFGFFGSPERQLLFDISDFDETFPGPYEWDVVRLATSFCWLPAAMASVMPSRRPSAAGLCVPMPRRCISSLPCRSCRCGWRGCRLRP